MSTSTLKQPPYTYDIVGSFLRPERLKNARAEYAAEKIDQAQLTAVEDECIAELVQKEKAAGLRAQGDFSDNSPGWKFANWEMKGVPLRVEIGPKDIEAGHCVAVRRDNGEKITVALDELEARIPELLETVQQGLFDKAKRNLDEHTYAAHSLAEAKELQEKNGGFIKTMWCGDLACELEMKEKAGMSSRCIPFEQEHIDDVCPVCGKPAKCMIYWGVAY